MIALGQERSRGRRVARLTVAAVDAFGSVVALAAAVVVERAAGWGDQRDGWRAGSFVTAAAVAVLWMFALLLTDSRDQHLLLAGPDFYARAIRATFATFSAAAIVVLAVGVEGARVEILVGFLVGVPTLVVGRWFTRKALVRGVRLGADGHGRQRVLSVAGPGQGDQVTLLASSTYPIFVDAGETTSSDPEAVIAAARAADADLVFVSRASTLTPRQVQILGWRLDSIGIGMCIEPSSSFIRPGKTVLLPHPSSTVLLVRTVHLSTRDRFIKRTADLVISVALLPLLLPIALLAALAIVAESGFPALYRQQRVGRNGRKFTLYKLRTMWHDADSQSHPPRSRKPQVDPRCTRVGRVLRRWSIDEIPQLWCVLAGSMSLVGPRPRLEPELADSPEEFRRLEARPGISGLWQTSGRSDVSFEEADLLDVEYVDNWSLIGDLVIMARTVRTVLGRRGAY